MLALLATAAVAFMGPGGVTAPAPRCVTAQAPRTMRPVAGVQLTNPMAMPRLATPRARVVAQAPGWKNNPAVVRGVAGVQLTNPMAMPRARLATPRARVVAQAPGWKNNPAVVGVKQLYDRVVDDTLAEKNVEEARANYEDELQKDPDSSETAYSAFALQAALNAYYEDELRLPPAIGAVGAIVAGALGNDLGDIF